MNAAVKPATGYNFAYLDEQTKRMIRRAILKGIAVPGYQVPFASREMPMPYGWGTGGVQVTAACLVPEDRKLQGVVLDHSIAENICYANLDKVAQRGVITRARLAQFADDYIRKFGVKGRGQQNAGELSGGNQQKVVLAKWFHVDVDLMIFDEPTRGVDVGAKSEIYALIKQFAARGRAVLVVSSEHHELFGLCDRVLVMREGAITGELMPDAYSEENLLKLARLGVCVLPPSPGFYQHPKTVDDIVDFVVARILDQLRIPHDLLPRWGE